MDWRAAPMGEPLNFFASRDSRALIVSQRGLDAHVANCCLYEFEDVIAAIDRVDMFVPAGSYRLSRAVFKLAEFATRSRGLANALRPTPDRLVPGRDYDLFLAILANLPLAVSIDAVRNWRRRCRTAVCFLFLGVRHSVEAVKRSRYFIANRANFMEGIAAGTILLGEPPKTPAFAANFDWPDAVIELPFDAAHIGEVIAGLDAQPERLERARRRNVGNALLRHDWLYRWEEVLTTAGLELPPGMHARRASLASLAERTGEGRLVRA